MDPKETARAGHITRRRFLDRATKVVIAGLAAGSVADRTAIERAFAETTPQQAAASGRRRPQRVGVVGIDHYHAISPPNYLQILANEKLDILGIHAPDAALAEKYAT